jgi:hypothetical protein
VPVAVQYTARHDVPDLLQRGRSTTLQCRVYRSGALVEPSAGTVSVYDSSGTAVVSAASVTVTSGVAQYAVSGATTSSLEPSSGWRVEWVLTMPDGVDHTVVNDAALCRAVPHPVVTEATLYQRVPALDPQHPACLTAHPDYTAQLDEAWTQVQLRLLQDERRVELVLSPSSLREVHTLLTLALVFEDLAGRLNPAHAEQARMYRQQYEAAWSRLDLRVYDTDDDGQGDARVSGRGSVWVM